MEKIERVDFYVVDFTNAFVQGSLLSDKLSFIQLRFESCVNIPGMEDCASLVEVNDYFMDDVIVNFAHADSFIDFSDLDNPVKINAAYVH